MVSKYKLECLLPICIYTNAKFIVICKARTLNDKGEDSVKHRNRKKYCFLAAPILLFIGKIIITWWPPRVIWKHLKQLVWWYNHITVDLMLHLYLFVTFCGKPGKSQ